MHEHTGVGDVVGMEIGNFEAVSRFWHFKLLWLFIKQF